MSVLGINQRASYRWRAANDTQFVLYTDSVSGRTLCLQGIPPSTITIGAALAEPPRELKPYNPPEEIKPEPSSLKPIDPTKPQGWEVDL